MESGKNSKSLVPRSDWPESAAAALYSGRFVRISAYLQGGFLKVCFHFACMTDAVITRMVNLFALWLTVELISHSYRRRLHLSEPLPALLVLPSDHHGKTVLKDRSLLNDDRPFELLFRCLASLLNFIQFNLILISFPPYTRNSDTAWQTQSQRQG